MAERLILFLGDDPDGPLHWLQLDQAERVLERGVLVGDEALPAELTASPATGLAAGTRVLLAKARVPTRSRQKLLQALPYAMEDQLADDVDTLHFALGQRDTEGAWGVAVVERDWLDRWQQRLAELGITLQRLIPETLCLPLASDHWCALLHAGQAVVRTGQQAGFAADHETLAVLLDAALEEAGEDAPQEIRLLHAGALPEDLDDTALPLQPEALQAPRDWLAAHSRDPHAINLLQGDYANNRIDRSLLRPWAAVAALFVAWMVLLSGSLVLEQRQLRAELAALDAAVLETLREVFPQATDVRQARDRLQTRLGQLEAGDGPDHGDGLLETLRLIGPILRQDEAITLSGMSWRGGNLEIELQGDSLQQIDRLSRQLNAANGISAEVRSASSGNEAVQGRLLVRRSSS
ncbi:type II secretion system protein GspL [Methylonatrum kenyense]|uniref:type II secretion system protein GspL n=1 Tax=Methylonatrum kenyense TaxID=455253 RepID=UPI0020BE85DA|nr:type II secretion system protein GspL [Methylonatrum kenyense]MCK8517026.1 type II secretion system protein GspL [Methylonatrum kenyense]